MGKYAVDTHAHKPVESLQVRMLEVSEGPALQCTAL